MQRRRLLDAARELLASGDGRVPSMAAVASRTGLSRPAVYQYFSSREDLLDAVVEDTFPRWSARLDEAVAAAGSAGERLLAYVDVNLALVAEGEHAVARGLAAAVDAQVLAERSAHLHAQLRLPLLQSLRDLGADDPELAADLVGALVYSASLMLEAGAALEVVRSNVRALLEPYTKAADADGVQRAAGDGAPASST